MSTPSPTSTRPSSGSWRAWPAPDKLRLLERLRQRARAGEGLAELSRFRGDPLGLIDWLWPAAGLYDRQCEVVESVRDNRETVVVAGNMLGKDYVAGAVVLTFFLCPEAYMPEVRLPPGTAPTVRVITTSVRDDHMRVLWGESGRFLASASRPLTDDRGGPLIVKHRDMRKIVGGRVCDVSYCVGMVSERGEGMAGHHAAYTLFAVDEASGVDDLADTHAETWAKRKLIFGNPNPCQNFFRRAVKAGDLAAPGES